MMNSIVFAFLGAFLIAQNPISAAIQPGDPDRILAINRDFLEVYEYFDETLVQYRGQQTNDERTLQAQFFSRVGFVTTEVQAIESAVRQQIVEHGIWIGNSEAECILEAHSALQFHILDTADLMKEVNTLASTEFARIPNNYVHPHIAETERLSKGLFNEVMLTMSRHNIVTDAQVMLDELEAQERELRNSLPSVRVGIQTEMENMRLQMNYVKSQVFPLLQYVLGWFQDDTNAIIANLQTCT